MTHRLLNVLTSLFVLPAVLCHELAHAIVATPVAKRVGIFDPVGTPSVHVEWREDASGWVIIASAYAPLISGILVGVAGLVWAFVSGPGLVPETARDWIVVGIGAIWYAIYVSPSPSDVQTAQEGINRVRE